MERLKLSFKITGGISVFLLIAVSSRASGFDLPNQDAFAVGRGLAFAATADNPSAIYYNPAGITQLNGNNLRLGGYGMYLDRDYTPPGGGETFDSRERLQGFPQFYYTYGKKDWPVSFGLGAYSPFAANIEWPQDVSFDTLATKGQLTTVTVNPVMAVKLFPGLSIGGGVMVNYAKMDIQSGIGTTPGLGLARFEGDDWAVGYNLGALWQPVKEISIGATFRSSTTVTYRGQSTTILPGGSPVYDSAYAHSSFPIEAVTGISYRPTPKWNLEFDADYMDWGGLSTLVVHDVSTPTTTTVPLNWQSSWNYEFGVTRYFDNGWHVSAGYIYSENSAPDANFTPLVVDSNRHFFSVGTGFTGKRFDFDVAYQFGYSPTRTVSGSPTAPFFPPQSADGSYDYTSQAVAVSVGMHF